MQDYPRTLAEFEKSFETESACRSYLERCRWPEGFECPRCRGREAWRSQRGLWVCRSCLKQVSVTAGTLFQDTHKDLRTWFRVLWWVGSQKNGVSALGFQRLLDLGSYETAWSWLHKLRRAMVRPGRDRLGGVVEVDETYWGGTRPGPRGRGAVGKCLIVVAVQAQDRRIGRIRLGLVGDGTASSLTSFVQQAVEPGTEVVTDGNSAYDTLNSLGYRHKKLIVHHSGNKATALLPRVHLVVSLLKRWLLGTHQGAVAPHQLGYYLDEFTFRFNRRTSRSRGLLFYRLIGQAVQLDPKPYAAIISRRS